MLAKVSCWLGIGRMTNPQIADGDPWICQPRCVGPLECQMLAHCPISTFVCRGKYHRGEQIQSWMLETVPLHSMLASSSPSSAEICNRFCGPSNEPAGILDCNTNQIPLLVIEQSKKITKATATHLDEVTSVANAEGWLEARGCFAVDLSLRVCTWRSSQQSRVRHRWLQLRWRLCNKILKRRLEVS